MRFTLPFLSAALLLVTSSESARTDHKHQKRTPKIPTLSKIPVEPQFFPDYESQRHKFRYGPFMVPGSGENGGMKKFQQSSIPKPCSDCLITWMKADLEFEDGSVANADTGLWLHHTVVSVTNRRSLNCGSTGEPFFLSGNERTAVDLALNGTAKVGYYLAPGDNVGALLELMNMLPKPQAAYLTVTFEYIPEGIPDDFQVTKLLLLDVAGCRPDREVPMKAKTGAFEYQSPVWTSDAGYLIHSMYGHVHDGGVRQVISLNDEPICETKVAYGETPAYISHHQHSMDGALEMDGTKHISSISKCIGQHTLTPSDYLSSQAFYDLSAHTPMLGSKGKLENAMGISGIWLVETDTGSSWASTYRGFKTSAEKLKEDTAHAIKYANKYAIKHKKTSGGAFFSLVLLIGLAFCFTRCLRRRSKSKPLQYEDRENMVELLRRRDHDD